MAIIYIDVHLPEYLVAMLDSAANAFEVEQTDIFDSLLLSTDEFHFKHAKEQAQNVVRSTGGTLVKKTMALYMGTYNNIAVRARMLGVRIEEIITACLYYARAWAKMDMNPIPIELTA